MRTVKQTFDAFLENVQERLENKDNLIKLYKEENNKYSDLLEKAKIEIAYLTGRFNTEIFAKLEKEDHPLVETYLEINKGFKDLLKKHYGERCPK